MNKGLVGLLVSLSIVVFLVISSIIAVVGAANDAVVQEEAIKARWNDNRQVLGNYTTRIGEMAQVPAMKRDDLKEVMEASFTGRYGSNGSQAVFQMIKENYPGQVTDNLYDRLQQEMAAGRRDFQESQTQLLDQKRIYSVKLNQPISGFWLHIAGYPKINLDDYNIVTSTASDKAFKTGVDDGVKLR